MAGSGATTYTYAGTTSSSGDGQVIARGSDMYQRFGQGPTGAEAPTRSYAAPPSAPVVSPSNGSADELDKLAQLRDRGVLSPDEFAAQKAKLLA